MERGRQKLGNVMDDGLGRDLINAGRFCFSCEQIFANRKCRDEHMCSATSFICSCGTEFTEYKDMLEHSTTHEPGHQVLDHETIRKRRLEKRKEEEEQLKRFQTGDVVWKAPKLDNAPLVSLPVKSKFQVPMQSAQISKVPEFYPSVSQASVLPNTASSTTDIKNIFANVGAPTVDLWTLYQPVVLLQTISPFNRKVPYTCGKCGQGFLTKTSLISHHSSHVTDKVSGCIGCGLLLSSKKLVPRFHVCNSPSITTKFKIITARPSKLNKAFTEKNLKQIAGGPLATSSQHLKSKNLFVASKGSKTPHIASTLQMKKQNMKIYNQISQRLHVSPSLQLKSQNLSASKPGVSSPFSPKGKIPYPGASNRSRSGPPVIPSRQLNMPMNSVSGLFNKPTKISSPSNGSTCRVCHISFESSQLLQRHKCVKAKEFMAQQGRGGKQQYQLNRVTPVASPNLAQMNGERKLAIGLDQVQGTVPVIRKIAVDVEDDCYIVEGEPDKPAEMIYQVTSSVPIKT